MSSIEMFAITIPVNLVARGWLSSLIFLSAFRIIPESGVRIRLLGVCLSTRNGTSSTVYVPWSDSSKAAESPYDQRMIIRTQSSTHTSML